MSAKVGRMVKTPSMIALPERLRFLELRPFFGFMVAESAIWEPVRGEFRATRFVLKPVLIAHIGFVSAIRPKYFIKFWCWLVVQ
jgi:hypothetical protein